MAVYFYSYVRFGNYRIETQLQSTKMVLFYLNSATYKFYDISWFCDISNNRVKN